ncbi:response regulator transcription factor [Candidatus Omnitrophota bacterium]
MDEKTRVLLVDDELDYTQPMAFWLKSKGYEVDVVSNGKSAIEVVRDNPPDIMFLDLKMPIMDGIETLRNIREFNKKIPIIIVTVEYANEDKFEQARKLGSNGFFPKKGSFEELENTIEVTLRIHKRSKSK